jgi:hypothetical protein
MLRIALMKIKRNSIIRTCQTSFTRRIDLLIVIGSDGAVRLPVFGIRTEHRRG